jgi:hypothetical protein
MSVGSILGGIVGAVVGYYSGNTSLGFAVGSAIGGALDPDVIKAPSLADRSVQVSTQGVPIPIVYGGTRGAGNVIWSTDLQESVTEDSSCGGPTVERKTYSVSCAIMICEPPIGEEIAGVRRIWADAKLVVDFSDDADEATKAASALFWDHCRFHGGSEDQLPDATMEAELGVGNVCAYKGICYITMTDLPLQDYGNRLPQFRFETSGILSETNDTEITYEALKVYPWQTNQATTPFLPINPRQTYGGLMHYRYNTQDFTELGDAIAYAQTVIPDRTFYQGYTSGDNGEFGGADSGLATSNSAFAVGGPTLGTGEIGSSQYATAWYSYLENNYTDPTSPIQVLHGTAGSLFGRAAAAGMLPPGPLPSFLNGSSESGQLTKAFSFSDPDRFTYPWFDSNSVGESNLYEGVDYVVYALVSPGIAMLRVPSPPPDVLGCPVGDPCLLGEPAEVPGNVNYCIACDGTVTKNTTITYEIVSGEFKQLAQVEYRDGVLYQNGLGPVLLPDDPDYNNSAFWDARAIEAGANLQPDIVYPVVVSSVAKGTGITPSINNADEADTTLDAIVLDICRRAGMPDELVDVSELEGIVVQGYAIARETPARAAIDPLQQTYWWDFVESERKLKAVRRGAASALTIGLDDLGATEGDESPIAVQPNRAQESELPQVIEVSYPCRLMGYETATQRDRRTTTASRQKINIELAVVMIDQHAANVAQVLMYMSWTNRTTREWSTTRKFSHVEPTDVVTLDDGEFQHVVRIIEKSEEGPVIKWKGVDERPASYSPSATPAAGGIGVGGVRFDGPMKLELIDSPLVDESDDAGHYAVAAGYRDTWSSGTAYKSIDAGTSYAAVRAMNIKGTIGYALSVLPDWTGGNVVDESSTVTVQMHYGTLATITQAALLNGGNLAILGDELIQFKRAELIAADTYLLTGFLRARKGTEQHTGTHAVSDRFVLFQPTTVYRFPDTLDGLNVPAVWKGVTTGQTLADANEIDFTNTGAGLKPLAPVHVHFVDIGGGQYRGSWVRRTRIGGKWRDGVDVPLSEASEAYAVVVNGGAAVTVTSPTIDITAAPGDTVTVYQLSSTVGRGFPAAVELV